MVVVVVVFHTIFMAAICLMIRSLLNTLPEEHRQLEMRHVWWLVVPCFNLAWNFFVFPRLARSFAGYFRSQGSSDADGTVELAMGFCIVSAISAFDVLGARVGRVVPVLLLVLLLAAAAGGGAGYKFFVLDPAALASGAVEPPKPDPVYVELRPAFVEVPIELDNELAISILVSVVSMTPGSLAADLSQDRRYAGIAIPQTESLKDTIARVLPYWEQRIAPALKDGQRVLISAHGNSLRALVKHLSGISDDDITSLEIPTGQPIVYDLDADLNATDRYYLNER